MEKIQGLAEREVEARRATGQGNNIDLNTSRSYRQILWYNLFSFINTILFIIGGTLLVMGLLADAITTAGLVLLNVIVGVTQEARAKRKLDRIALLTRPRVTVIRERQEKVIDPSELVMGDVLVIRSGDQMMVDGKVIGEGRVDMDESLLTGESDAITKRAGDILYSGSYCVTGMALGEVTKVGASSFANQLTAKARDFKASVTPLQRDVNFLVRLVAFIAVPMTVLLYMNAVRDSSPLSESVQMSAVVVALIPQGLIFLTTLSYALGAVRMAGKGALIQQINAVESMSHVDVLCLDKTGTLTANRINFHEVRAFGMSEDKLRHCLGIYAASVPDSNRTTDALKAALPAEPLAFVEHVPFSSERKWSALAFDRGENAMRGIYVMGAPEILKPYLQDDTTEADFLIEEWTKKGLRVVMFAHYPEVVPLTDENDKPRLPKNLTLPGLVSFSDELRPEARETLLNFLKAGIQFKIISGDNPQTVEALARQTGLEIDMQVISGAELVGVKKDKLADIAESTTIFGRITPDQKEYLVDVLKSRGHYVAMIGDGVNDVLSLKKANIGIAMQSGSAATRNVADIVLLDDSFAALPSAFTEGQRLVNGMQDVARVLLTRTTYVAFLVVATAMIGVTFPFLPRHDALLSLFTAGIPPMAIAAWARFGQPESNRIKKLGHFILPAAITITPFSLAIYLYFLDREGLEAARTAITVYNLWCGFLLLLYVEPPLRFFAILKDRTYRRDRRLTGVAITLFVLLWGILLVAPLRDFFKFIMLEPTDFVWIGVIALLWSGLLKGVWNYQVFERILGMRHFQWQ